MPDLVSSADAVPTGRRESTDPVGLSWLVTVRWTTFVAGAGAVVAGRSALEASVPLPGAAGLLAIFAASNLWLTWRVRAGRTRAVVPRPERWSVPTSCCSPGCCSGRAAVLNPASVFYLVADRARRARARADVDVDRHGTFGGRVRHALSHADRRLDAAQVMHPEISIHMRGMWLAFAFTALIIGVLVTRLAIAVERRDRALDLLRDRTRGRRGSQD